MKITRVESIPLQVSFLPDVAPHMHRSTGNWSRSFIQRIETDGGLVGWGESNAGQSVASADQLVGTNPAAHLFDDSVGMGIQMACFDLAGQELGVPAYRLLGPKAREWCPFSWWCIDMPAEDWVAQVQYAAGQGYRSVKLKARAWRDIIAQIAALDAAAPPGFTLEVDFNGQLIEPGRAIIVLRELEQFERLAMFESPIPQEDAEGYRQIRRHISRTMALHIGTPPVMTVIRDDLCDGFVMGGGLSEMLARAATAHTAGMPFWFQFAATGIGMAFTCHLIAALPGASWPSIALAALRPEDYLCTPLTVRNGFVRVPEAPGLGVQIDEAAIRRDQVPADASSLVDDYFAQRRVLRIRWADGTSWLFGDDREYRRMFDAGQLPIFERGVTLESIEDDGSAAFARLHARVAHGPTPE